MRAALWQVRHAQVDDGRPRRIKALVPERALVDRCQIGGVAYGLMGGRRRHERYEVVEVRQVLRPEHRGIGSVWIAGGGKGRPIEDHLMGELLLIGRQRRLLEVEPEP